MSSTKWNFRRSSPRIITMSGLAALALTVFVLQGFAQVDPDRDPAPPDRPPVRPPAEPVDPPDLQRGLPPETADTPVTRPATLVTYTGKAGLVDSDEDKVTLLVDDGDEEKTFTIDPEAKITVNGKPGRLKDILAGDVLKIVSHKAEPSVARSIVAARVTEHTDKEPSPRPATRRDQSGRIVNSYSQGGEDGGAGATAVAGGGGGSGMVVPIRGRVFTLQVIDGSPAAEAGLLPGDTILLVGPDNVLPNNTVLNGGGTGLNRSRLGTGLVLLPDGTLGFGNVDPRTGLFNPGIPGINNPGVGTTDGTGNQTDGTGNQNDGAAGNQNQNVPQTQQGAPGAGQQRQPGQNATGTNQRGTGAAGTQRGAGAGTQRGTGAGTQQGTGTGTQQGTGAAGARGGTGAAAGAQQGGAAGTQQGGTAGARGAAGTNQ